MNNIFSNDVIYMFYVSIILINVEIISSKGEIPAAYVTDIYYSWKKAHEICEMIRLYDNIQFPDTYGTLSCVDAPVEYSQWVEYKDCVHVKPEFIEKHKRVPHGDQLVQCLQYCEDNDYIGLQQSNCSCLGLSEMSHNTVISGCSQKEICRGDKYAYCANGISKFNCFIIYKKVNINEQLHIGNCLKVTRAHDQKSSFRASPCDGVSKPLCTSMRSFFGHSQNWISSFSQCKPELFVSYDRYKQSQLWQEGLFWLANIRRPYINHSPEFEPKYYMAVTTRTGDHRVYTYVRQCTEKLPVLCAVTNKTSPENIPSTYSVEIPELDFIVNTTKNTVPSSDITTFTISVEVPELDSNDKASNNILLITLVITAVLAVVVFIVVIVVCIRRRNSSRTRHQQTPVPTNEVTYAQVNKPTKEKTPDHAGEQTRKNPADDTYDHMEHHRLSKNQIPTESNYDTMQSGGNEELENDYDVTSGTDRPRQIVVDDSSEYSHVQVEHHEIKDPSA